MIVEEIAKMNGDELNRVIDAVKARRKELAKEVTRTLKVGDRVKFVASKKGIGTVKGEVTKVNRKTVIVKEDDSFRTWKVSATLLEVV